MFLCHCGIWIDCSIHGANWDRYIGIPDNWNDCPRRCNDICVGQTYMPQYTNDWKYFNNIFNSSDFIQQQNNRHAHIGTVADNFFR